MTPDDFMNFSAVLEKLKCNVRHSWTSTGRQESVAEHSWRLAMYAILLEKDFPDLDMGKVIRMCLIHDWGEAVTGDIPAFLKTGEDEETEAVVQHNEADIRTWIPLEYDLQMAYGEREASAFPFTRELKKAANVITQEKIAAASGT